MAVVATRSGRVDGAREGGVHVFRGIPYARAERFRPPEPPKPWTDVRPATRFGAAAPQPGPLLPLLRGLSPPESAQGEDCHTLNVWTRSRSGARPVMVWIHGGAFSLGTGATRLYSGQRLARRDVVAVTFNYRLGALGFLQLPGVCANLGLLDQVAALEWVRDHIDAFGGDPGNVTIFGESAGGMSVATLLAVPRARGLFHRAVAQSGAAHHVSSQERAADIAEQFVRELGSPDLDGLRRVPAPELIRAQTAAARHVPLPLGTLPWQPVVDGDVLPEPPLDAIRAGAARGLPLLVGTNRDEWKLFQLADRRGRSLDEAGLRGRFERTFRDRPDLVERACETYRDGPPRERWSAFQSDRIFHVPAQRLLEAHASHTRATYAYLFSWTPPVVGGRVGACHGLEIPFVFGTLPWTTRGARLLSRRMREAWVTFAQGGHPGHPGLPYWPRWKPETRATLVFDAQPRIRERPFDRTLALWDGIL